MDKNDVVQILGQRSKVAELVGNPCPCNNESLRLEAGDDIILNRLPGWTKREYFATPHLHLVANEAAYMLEYWSAEWSGVPNLAKERGEKLAEQKKQEQEAENKAYDEIYGPPPAYRGKKFENFAVSDKAATVKVSQISDWPWKYNSKENDEEICWPDSDTYYLNLILAGPPGTGKTHLACALYFAHPGAVVYGSEIIRFETLVRKFKEKEQKDSTLFRRYGDGFVDGKNKMDWGCELLIIDDVGVDKSDYARQILIEIIDRRNAAGLLTVITTNLSKAELSAMLGDRGASRLFHRCLAIGMTGADYRAKPPNSDTSEV